LANQRRRQSSLSPVGRQNDHFVSLFRTDPFSTPFRFYDRKKQQTNPVIATKALACKLAKAAWHVMAENVPYDGTRVFGPGRKSDLREPRREPAKGSGRPSHVD
jgi:hypothetical protein